MLLARLLPISSSSSLHATIIHETSLHKHLNSIILLRLGSCTQVSYMKFSSPFTGSFEVLSCICCFARLKTVLNDVLHSLNGISIAKGSNFIKMRLDEICVANNPGLI